jgi:hypothetical protein
MKSIFMTIKPLSDSLMGLLSGETQPWMEVREDGQHADQSRD